MALDTQIPLQVQNTPLINPLQSIGQIMQMRNLASEVQQRQALAEQERQHAAELQAQTAQRNRDLSDQNAVQELMKDPENAKAFGAGDFSALNGKVQPATINKLTTSTAEVHAKLATTHQIELKNMAEQHAMIADAINGLKALGSDEAIAQEAPNVFNRLQAEGILPAGTPQPKVSGAKDLDTYAAQNGWLQGTINGALKTQKEKQGLESSKASEGRAEGLAPGALELQGQNIREKTAEADMKQRQAELMLAATPEAAASSIDSMLEPKVHPKENSEAHAAYSSVIAAGGTPKEANAEVLKVVGDIRATDRAVATAKATAPIKIETSIAEQRSKDAARTPGQQALDLMAEDLLNGKTPSSRNPVTYAQVYQRAAELAKEHGLSNQQVVMERAAVKANTQALGALTKQHENVEAFSRTAEANMQQLEQRMKDVADYGAPVLNTPIRALSSRFVGDPKVAAFQASLQPVQAEIGRILGSANANGVLTDSMRHEVEGALSPGATPAQLHAALDVFRKDIQNRRDSYKASIEDLKGHTAVGTTHETAVPTASAPKATHRFNPSTGRIEEIK